MIKAQRPPAIADLWPAAGAARLDPAEAVRASG